MLTRNLASIFDYSMISASTTSLMSESSGSVNSFSDSFLMKAATSIIVKMIAAATEPQMM